jgi:pimeloyl-ACP methyl ester carboxylesterase
MKKYNGTNNLKLIKNETLIIWGDGDKSYNYKQIQTLKGNISNSSLVIFKKCAHNIHLEKIEKFNRTIQKFLNK